MTLQAHIDQLERLTDRIIDQLYSATYEEIVELIDERGRVIDALVQVEAAEQERVSAHERIRLILEADQPILSRLNQWKAEASAQMNRISGARVQKNAYESAYADHSIFYDNRQ